MSENPNTPITVTLTAEQWDLIKDALGEYQDNHLEAVEEELIPSEPEFEALMGATQIALVSQTTTDLI